MIRNTFKFNSNILVNIKKMFNTRTFLTYFILVLLIPFTVTDKHNRSNNVQKRPDEARHTGGCHSCRMREEIKQRNLMIIKDEILRRMGFEEAPNITGKSLPSVPSEFLMKFEEENGGMQSDQPQFQSGYTVTEEEDDYHVKTEKILGFAQPYPRLRHKGRDILHFSFSDSITKYQVSNSTLSVFIKGSERRLPQDVILEVFKITDHSDPAAFDMVYGKKFRQPPGKGEWINIDFTETVSEWFKNPSENYGFVVNATVNGKKVVVTDVNVDKGKKVPFIEISTVEAKHRVRRSMGLNCDDDSNETICCRYPLMVDFEAIGLDFIIAPKRYDAYMCSGECPYVTLQKFPHTHLKQITKPVSTPPCCTPRKLGSISMLYFDQHLNVMYGSLPGMVVERCGCM
ncbi:growth/differentiation factor 8 isoform X1 [Diorhabda sublineata]|uniref:growth/differentiation factor 8 isoform X1 n=1 Tax=Diorhabda sublineata TaxID=1163346 RepID=UPI0024E0A3A4|nr:growth/differentiation factor 8 isoform X1 [Diorhabda sublineata]